MDKTDRMTKRMAEFIMHISSVLPDDVIARLKELAQGENDELPRILYETMEKNQELAKQYHRPSCQDTGALQFFVKCGTGFPLINELESLLKEAVRIATKETPP